MGYSSKNYKEAIEFALNYPPKVMDFYYDQHKDIFKIQLLDDGIYNIKLLGSYVRSCLAWKGIKKWRESPKK